MGQSESRGDAAARGSQERLDSWKDIAAYFGRDVTTVQRWEKRERLPVHRHMHDRSGSIYAFRGELEAWALQRSLRAGSEPGCAPAAGSEAAAPPTRVRSALRAPGGVLLLVAGLALAAAALLWWRGAGSSWRDPIAGATFQVLTDFDGVEQAAAVSRDGQFVAFLSDRDGQMDVWLTQVGSGQFHNLTRGSMHELVNPSIRSLGFSPDGSLVTFWVGRSEGKGESEISIWAVPTLGGQPRPYLEGVAEFDWSRDGSRLAYHTPGPGDPLFVSDGLPQTNAKPVYAASAGLHSHFPLWSPDLAFIYFVHGSRPGLMDVWRVSPAGRPLERITNHAGRVSHPVLLDRRTLLYLACGPDGSGPWLYGTDVGHRTPHRLSSGLDSYTSLAASEDGRRLVLTRASPKRTLWRLRGALSRRSSAAPVKIALTTGTGFSPRLGKDFLLYISGTGASESIWKLAGGVLTELWRAEGATVLGGPSISSDGKRVAFSTRQRGRTLLWMMRSDGTGARIVTKSLDLHGAPSWGRDGQSIITGVSGHGTAHLVSVPLDGGPPSSLMQDSSAGPVWAPGGGILVYLGPEIGPASSLKAVTASGAPYPMPAVTLSRGARRLAFLDGGRSIAFLRGEPHNRNVWAVDIGTGAERQLTAFTPDFNIQDFDISPDGTEIVLERVQEHSDLVLLDLPRR